MVITKRLKGGLISCLKKNEKNMELNKEDCSLESLWLQASQLIVCKPRCLS